MLLCQCACFEDIASGILNYKSADLTDTLILKLSLTKKLTWSAWSVCFIFAHWTITDCRITFSSVKFHVGHINQGSQWVISNGNKRYSIKGTRPRPNRDMCNPLPGSIRPPYLPPWKHMAGLAKIDLEFWWSLKYLNKLWHPHFVVEEETIVLFGSKWWRQHGNIQTRSGVTSLHLHVSCKKSKLIFNWHHRITTALWKCREKYKDKCFSGFYK